jgi:hypothetical protein
MLGRVMSGAPSEILVPETAGASAGLPVEAQIVGSQESCQRNRALSYTVDRLPARTVAKHGISGPELERHSAALRFMELRCRPRTSKLWWISVAKASDRKVISNIQKRITKVQGRLGLPKYSAWIFETLGGIHAHITFIGDPDGEIARALQRSEGFVRLKAAPVTDPTGLVRQYLAKERTPQAGFRRQHLLGGRVKGAHYLAGGGDRVRLSRDLERDGIEAGYVEPWHSIRRRPNPTSGCS